MATPSTRQVEVRRVLLITLVANLAVAVAKVTVGLLTRSLAMVSDGIHSSLDATSNVIGLVSTAIAARPPDSTHPYGHRRFETLASMAIGGLLLLTAWEIIKGSIRRLSTGITPEVGPASFAVMIATLAVNLGVSTYEGRTGRRLRSEILQADAAHTRSDVFVSLAVLGGLVAVKLGLGWVDAAVALLVVALIGLAAWRIVSGAVNVLVDRAALEPDEVARVAARVPGVEGVALVRSRGPGDDIHLDLDVRVAAPTTAERGAAIAGEIRSELREAFEGLTDIQVYFLPAYDNPPDYALVARAEADALGLSVHEVIPSTGAGGLALDMHVEAAPDQTVGEAHEVVSLFEDRLQAMIPDLTRIVTHIEPAHVTEVIPDYDAGAHALAQRALALAQQLYPDNFWHDLDIRPEADGGYALSMHCYVDAEMSLEDAHRLAETLETRVRAILPELHRITIHTEPEGATD